MRTSLVFVFTVGLLAQVPEQHAIRPNHMHKPLVGFLALPLDDPSVTGALACVKQNLPLLRLTSTISASQRSVAVLLVTLRCHVEGEEGAEIWEFSTSRKAGKAWRLKSSRCIEE